MNYLYNSLQMEIHKETHVKLLVLMIRIVLSMFLYFDRYDVHENFYCLKLNFLWDSFEPSNKVKSTEYILIMT